MGDDISLSSVFFAQPTQGGSVCRLWLPNNLRRQPVTKPETMSSPINYPAQSNIYPTLFPLFFKDYGRKPNIALNVIFVLDVKRLEIGVKIYLIKTLRLSMPIAGFVQDNIMPSVSVKFHDLSVKHANKELNQNVQLSPEM